MRKRGQVTMFIILALIIVIVLLAFFLWIQPTYITKKSGALVFDSCIEDAIRQSTNDLGEKGGFDDPEFTYLYNGEKITYLCYTNEYFKTCTVQKPFLKQHFEDELEKRVRDEIETCYDSSIDELRAQGYSVTSGNIDYNITLNPGIITVDVEVPTTVGSKRFTKFDVEMPSPIYELLMISTSLLQFESKYGNTDTSSIMLFYPDYYVEKIKRGDSTTVYFVYHKYLGDTFKFASRSLAWPAGYTGKRT